MDKVSDSDIEYGDDTKYYYNGQLYTGVIIEYGDSGDVLSECEVNEGLMHGRWINYYPGGGTRIIDVYKHGYHTESTEYDRNGTISSKWSINDEDEPWFNMVKRRLGEIDDS